MNKQSKQITILTSFTMYAETMEVLLSFLGPLPLIFVQECGRKELVKKFGSEENKNCRKNTGKIYPELCMAE